MSVAILRVTRVPLDMRKHIIRITCVPLNIMNLYPTAHVSLGVYLFLLYLAANAVTHTNVV